MLDDMMNDEKPTAKSSKKTKQKKIIEFNEDTINLVMQGGKTIDEETNRPFWKFPKLSEYPYDHFVPVVIFIIGKKGSSKTTISLSPPGNIFALTFEKRGNLTRPWHKIFGKDPRIQPFGVSEYIERGSTGRYRDSSNTIYAKIIELMTRAMRHSEKFDWVVIDGLQSGQKITTQRMKALNSVGAFDNLPTKLLTRWGERTLYLENIVIDLATSIASKGVIITSQDVVHKAMFLTQEQEEAGMTEDEIPEKTPSWLEKVKEDSDTVIYTEIVEKKLSGGRNHLRWNAKVITNKLGGVGNFDTTLTKENNTKTIELIKHVLTSDIGFNTIKY